MNTPSRKIKLAVVGCGFLGKIIVDAWQKGLLPEYEFCAYLDRDPEATTALAAQAGGTPCTTFAEVLAEQPDYVIEAASPQVVRDIALATLEAGADLIVLSIGVFADSDFLDQVSATARHKARRVHLVSGAIGGFDVLRTAALMSPIEASITTEKGPASLRNTPIFDDHLMSDTAKTEVFAGTAGDAIALFPTKVNVAVATALATAGADQTRVSINSVPGFVGDDHRIEVRGEEVHAVVDIYSRTSAIAAWSVVARLRNLVSPIVF